MTNDFEIKEVDSIVATEILKATYGIDILTYTQGDVRKIIELLHITEASLPILKRKAYDNTIEQEKQNK